MNQFSLHVLLQVLEKLQRKRQALSFEYLLIYLSYSLHGNAQATIINVKIKLRWEFSWAYPVSNRKTSFLSGKLNPSWKGAVYSFHQNFPNGNYSILQALHSLLVRIVVINLPFQQKFHLDDYNSSLHLIYSQSPAQSTSLVSHLQA